MTPTGHDPTHGVTPENWREGAARLAGVSFLPGSWDKRFAKDMMLRAQDPEFAPTEKQLACLGRLLHRYRRQIKAMTVYLSPDQYRRICQARGRAFDTKLRAILGEALYRRLRVYPWAELPSTFQSIARAALEQIDP